MTSSWRDPLQHGSTVHCVRAIPILASSFSRSRSASGSRGCATRSPVTGGLADSKSVYNRRVQIPVSNSRASPAQGEIGSASQTAVNVIQLE